MSGMGSGLSTNNPTIVAAFHRALLRQGLAIFLILAVVAVAWSFLRSLQLRQAAAGQATQPTHFASPEPVARRLLRISFGLIWVFDGLLQAQASMPLGMIPDGVQPTAAASPGWVQHVVNAGSTIWTYHPVSAAAAAVWIQIGIGLWLLVAPRGDWSRLGGVASVAWGIIVWIFGESFGGVFAPGLTWLFGAPGAVIFYCVAGVLVALPERSWTRPRLGRVVLAGMGLFFVGMAVLQAWPGRGFWQGQARHAHTAGTLTAMVQQMAQTPQPHTLSSIVSGFASFDASHGWAVNLFAVIALALIGAAFLAGRPRLLRAAVIAGVVLCLADWVLIEDLGFLGGVGTDPNSMIPMALVFVAGYLALVRVPAESPQQADAPVLHAGGNPWRRRLTADPAYTFRSIAALAAIGVTLVGAAPMALAAANPNADPIITEAVDGPPTRTDIPAPPFDLTDQNGQEVTLSSLRGKAIALTFLDPVCTSDCPVIAQEFRTAATKLGPNSQNVEFVAIDANPSYLNRDYLLAFDQQEGLRGLANWDYLTGTLPALENAWRSYAVEVEYEPGGAMIDHSDIAYVIDPTGHTREVLDADPGPATQATGSAFSDTLTSALKAALRTK